MNWMMNFTCPHCGSHRCDTAGKCMDCPMPTEIKTSGSTSPIQPFTYVCQGESLCKKHYDIQQQSHSLGYAEGLRKAVEVVKNIVIDVKREEEFGVRGNVQKTIIEALEAAK